MKLSVGIHLLLATAILGGCALVEKRPAEDSVQQRAQERLDLMWYGKMEEAYLYTSPGYREIRSWQQYAADWAGSQMWKEAQVHRVNCGDSDQPDSCQVTVRVVFLAPRQDDPVTTFLEERWLWIDGEWYLYQKL